MYRIKVLGNGFFMPPFPLFGLWLGIKSAQVIDEKWVKRLVIVLLIVSGVIMIVNNI